MNENIFDVLYTLAQENGYTKSSEEFITLLQDNPEARKTMYDISLSEGFTKSLDEFENLVKIDKKKIRTRLEERQAKLEEQLATSSALMSENIFLESPEYDDVKKRFEAGKFTSEEKEAYQKYADTKISTGVGEIDKSLLPKKKNVDDSENPILQSIRFAIDEAYTNEEISEILGIQFGDEFTLTDDEINRLANLNRKLLTNPKSEARTAYDKAFEEALSEENKKLLEKPYGDIEAIKERFDKGEFFEKERIAYDHYKDTGEFDEAKLPKKELTFLDDLGAFYEAINKAGISNSGLALTEISISSQLGALMSDPARQAGLAGAFVGVTAGLASSGGALSLKAGLAGYFGASSAVYDSALRFNGFINEVLLDKNLPIEKSSYKKLFEDKDMIRSLRLKAIKGGLSVGIIDGLTMMLSTSVGSAGSRMIKQAKGRVARGATSAGTVAATTGTEMTGGGIGERVAQIASDEPYNGRDIIEEAFAEGPIGGATGVMSVLRSTTKSYKIAGSNVSEEVMNDFVREGTPEQLKGIDISIKNDNTLSKIYSDKIKTDTPVEKTPEVTAEKEVSEEASTEVDDIEMSDLEQTLVDQGVQFQLSTDVTPEEKKAELLNIAVQQIKEAQSAEISEDVYEANKVDVEKTKIDYSSQPLSKGVPQVNSDVLIDKMINLVMADQLMVGEIETSSGKKLRRMGGVFFSLIPELKDKIAWASIDLKSARDIVRGAIKADETVVFNMKPTAIDSNVALVEYAFQQIKGKSKNEANLFKNFKKYFSTLKVGDKLKKAINDSKDFNEVLQKFPSLSTNNRARLIDILLPTESVENTIPYKKQLVELGITAESARDANIEESIKDAPMGAMLSMIEVTDENGNKITDPADIDKAIVTREQAIQEGLPIHENYPFYIRGMHKALINETTPFWNYMPKALEKIDLKIAEVIKQKSENKETGAVTERRLSSKEARSAEQRAATMSAATAKKAVGPDVTQYEKFVNMISKSIPGINVVTDEKGFSEFRDDIYSRKMVTKTQKVYGAVRGNTLYLNPDLQNFNTPIHELGHLWTNTVKELQPELYNKGISLVKNSIYQKRVLSSEGYKKVVKEMKNNGFSNAEINNYILEEALATAIGDKGESYVKASTMQKFRSWLQNLYDFIKTKLGISQFSAEDIENMNLDQFTEAVAVDILKGEPLFEESQVKTIDELQLQTSDADIYEIIRVARNNGFPDSAIEKFLLKRGFKKKQIAEAKKINLNALQELPASFYNAGRTALDGLSLFEKAFEYARKRVKKFGSEKAIDLTTNNLIIKSPIFKNSDDIVKEEMIRDFGKFMGKKFKSSPNPERVLMGVGRMVLMPTQKTKNIQDDYRNLKRKLWIKNLNEGAKNLLQLQREIRNYIRKNIPRADYNKSTTNKLIKLVTDAKTDVEVSSAIDQVNDIIVETNSNIIQNKLIKLLNLKTVSKKSGRAVARSVSAPVKERLDNINKLIQANPDELSKKIESIQDPTEKTDSTLSLEISIALNNEDKTDASRLESLSFAFEGIKSIIDGGRVELAEQISARSNFLNNNVAEIYEAITGIQYEDTEQGAKNRAAYLRKKEQQQSSIPKFKKKWKNLQKSFNNFFLQQEDITGKLNTILAFPGEVVGGRLEELITDTLDESSIKYKKGKREIDQLILDNAKRIFGKKYKIALNNNATVAIPLNIGDEVYSLTQNQMYPILMNMKDPSLRPGYEARFGEKLNALVDEINKNIDPNVLEWANWQVNILFPFMYERYNPTYKRMYYTNMPFNKKYAGRVYREGSERESIDLLNPTQNYRASVSSSSTKVRVANKNRIELLDGDQNLSTYVRDMEYWNAFSESIRDISHYINQKDIQDAITHRTNSDVYRFIKKHIDIVATKGIRNTRADKVVNTFITPFILSRLALNPTIGIKQLTSVFAYSADIGPAQYVKYLAKSMPEARSLWKEISNNSEYIKDRYAESINKQIAVYSDDQLVPLIDSKVSEISDKAVRVLMYFIKTGDKGGIMGGIPNYLYYKEQYLSKNPEAPNEKVIEYAIRKFEKDTKKAQQSSDIQDRDLFQLEPSTRWLNAYQTSPRQYNRKVVAALLDGFRSAKRKDTKGVAKNLYKFLLFHSLLPMLYQWVGSGMAGLLRGYEDEYDNRDMIRAAILGNINSWFVAGDLISSFIEAAEGKFYAADMKNIPLYEVARPAIKTITKAQRIKDPIKRNKLYHDLYVDLAGTVLPANQVKRYYENIVKVAEGDFKSIPDLISLLLNYSEYSRNPKK